ncbi:hypothetical protein BH23GEM10_BH23GEM10_05680 [soil metagenome]
MSEWFYVSLAYGMTWATFAGYMIRLHLIRIAAKQNVHESSNGGSA